MLNQTFCISTKIDAHRTTKLYSWKNEHFHLWFIFSWQGGWFKKKRKENDAKTIPCTGKSKKVRKSCTVDKGSDEGKNKTAFLQWVGPTLISPEKVQNQSQLPATSAFPSTFLVSHWGTEFANSIFLQWKPWIQAAAWLTNTGCFSTRVIPCFCLDAADLYQTQHLALCPLFHERLRPTLR